MEGGLEYARQGPTRRETRANGTEMDEEDIRDDEGSFDDDFIDPDVADNAYLGDEYNRADQVSKTLLFLVQELGGVKKTEDGVEAYIPGPTCEKGIKDIVRYCKFDKPDDQLTKYYLGKWNTLQKDILPLFLSQSKNKKLIYHVLTIIAYLTAEPEKKCQHYDELTEFNEDYKEILTIPEFSDQLVSLLGEVVKNEEKTKFHENMVELIVVIIRNLLQIQVSSNNVADAYKDGLQLRLYMNFSKSSGIFDALIYLCQDMGNPLNKRLRLVFLEIFYSVLSSFQPFFLFGSSAEEEFFKTLRDREKMNRVKRLNQLSTRHSRFGAMYEVVRKIGNTSAITGSINFKKDDLNKLEHQRNKPKPNKRYAPSADTQILGHQIISENHGALNEEERNTQLMLRHFVQDFIEHAYEPLIDCVYDQLSKEHGGAVDKDYLHFFVVMGFGIECYTLEFERSLASLGLTMNYSRPIVEEKMTCRFSYIIHGVQVTLIDILYKTLVGEIAKKKNEFNIKVYHACLHYFLQILTATMILSRSSHINDQKNANLLKQIIFSKEFSKILKIGFTNYEPKLHGGKYVETLVRTQDAFFNLLAAHAKDRILSAKTDKVVRRAAKRAKNAVKVRREDTNPGTELDMPDQEDAAGDDDEEIGDSDGEDDFVFKERRYNYYSEFSSFVDYPTLQKTILLIRGEKLVWNNKRLNQAVYNYMYRIVNDLKGEWVFFQNDFMFIFNEILQNSLVTFKKENAAFISLIRSIVKKFFDQLHNNPLLAVESMYRFQDLMTKDRILNNYELATPIMVKVDEEIGEQIERKVIPWSKAEDMILVENFEYFQSDEDPFSSLSNLLKDQAYFREPKDVKMRVKLLKLDKNREIALQLVEDTHRAATISLEEAVCRFLLYTHGSNRSFEKLFFQFATEALQNYSGYLEAFPLTPGAFPVIPVSQHDFDILEWPIIGGLLDCLGWDRPSVGKIYWRLAGPFSQLEDRYKDLKTQYDSMKNLTESELLDRGDKWNIHGGVRKQTTVRNGAAKSSAANKEPKSKKMSKKDQRQKEKNAEKEALHKMNRELAGIVSDEELDMASDESEEEDELDYGHHSDDDEDIGINEAASSKSGKKAARSTTKKSVTFKTTGRDDEDDNDDTPAVRRRKVQEESSAAGDDAKSIVSDFREEFKQMPNGVQPNLHTSTMAEEEVDKKFSRLKKRTTKPAGAEEGDLDDQQENSAPNSSS